MTLIPLEVLITQECPPGSSHLSGVFSSRRHPTCLFDKLVGVLSNHCTGIEKVWTQGWSSQSQLQGRMGLLTQHPNQVQISPF